MKTLDDLKLIRTQARKGMSVRESGRRCNVVVAMDDCGMAAGARDVVAALLDEINKRELTDVALMQSGCRGLCDREPTMEVVRSGEPVITYGSVSPERARNIIAEHVVNGHVISDWVVATESR